MMSRAGGTYALASLAPTRSTICRRSSGSESSHFLLHSATMKIEAWSVCVTYFAAPWNFRPARNVMPADRAVERALLDRDQHVARRHRDRRAPSRWNAILWKSEAKMRIFLPLKSARWRIGVRVATSEASA